ncbi:MAG: hypothetical protein BZ138_00915 [Methanosphaera sp. rholeuAM270]|nr:MAG: hypothetical protein BZ138_00915 [Methanosphaera sp. rholeuAM270]
MVMEICPVLDKLYNNKYDKILKLIINGIMKLKFMIDWDKKSIERIDRHYREVLYPSINFTYFCRHFEEIYKVLLNEEEILPDILNDITFYTFNGINARYKILVNADEDKKNAEKLLSKITEQKLKRQEARNRGLSEYHSFIIREVEDFIEKYPFWKEMLRY